MVRTTLLTLALLAPVAAQAKDECPFQRSERVSLRLTHGVIGGKLVYYRGKPSRERFQSMLLACGMTDSARKFRHWRTARQVTNGTLIASVFTGGYLLPVPIVSALVATAEREALRTTLLRELRTIRREPDIDAPAPPPPAVEPAPEPEPPKPPPTTGWAALDLDEEQAQQLAAIRADLDATAQMLYLRLRASKASDTIHGAQEKIAALDALADSELAAIPGRPPDAPIAQTLDGVVAEAEHCAEEAQLATDLDVAQAAASTCARLYDPTRLALTHANERLKTAQAERRAYEDARAAQLAWESKQGQRDNTRKALLLSGVGMVAAGVLVGIEGHQNAAWSGSAAAYGPGIALGVVGLGLGAGGVAMGQLDHRGPMVEARGRIRD